MKRIQRKRIKGWRMPPNTIYVGRPSKWGNPYRVGDDVNAAYQWQIDSVGEAIAFYRKDLKDMKEFTPKLFEEHIAPLRGHDIACWCALDKLCHADVLIAMISEEQSLVSRVTR